jgi:hypothetical protein
MYQLVYTSKAAQPFSDGDLKKLLVGARMRNTEASVTGMLVYHGDTFLQALEGEKEAVLGVFQRIRSDPRHRAVNVLHRGMGPEQRIFGEWSMGFSDFTGAAGLLKGFVAMDGALDLPSLDGPRAVKLLAAVSG